MSSDCTDVAGDIEQRIVQLSARIYSHQNLIAQYTQEKERLQCILDNLNTMAEESDNSDDDAVSDDDVVVVDTPIYHNPSTSLNNDGPWQ